MARKLTASLNEWRGALLYLLDTKGISSSLLLPVFLRQRNVLNLAYWHAIILVHRPFLLSTFSSFADPRRSQRIINPSSETGRNIQRCLDAAMKIVGLVDELNATRQIYRAFWVLASIPGAGRMLTRI